MKKKAGSFHLVMGLQFLRQALNTIKSSEVKKYFPGAKDKEDVLNAIADLEAQGKTCWPPENCDRVAADGHCMGHGPMFEESPR